MNNWGVVLFCLVCYLSGCASTEIEEELKRLNKPALKTIATRYGDVYDCIDFYKQPAFDHPLLKNHTREYHQYDYQMFPRSTKKMNKGYKSAEIERLADGGCPAGTVPIRRTTKEELMRAKIEPQDKFYTDAIIRTKGGDKYKGSKTMMSVYNPEVSETQMSIARMTLVNGHDTVEVGWAVYPWLYGDNVTRFYIYYTSDSTACFNTRCPGFVVVNTHIPLDGIITPVSKPGGPIYALNMFLYREEASGNWWVAVGDNLDPIGYWPKKLFTGLRQDLALSVEWGGTTHWEKDELDSPGMGSGYVVEGNVMNDAFCAHVKIVNAANEFAEVGDTEHEYLNPNIYKAQDLKMLPDLERVFVFGGPGYADVI